MSNKPELPLHGGDIISAAKRYGIDEAQWIDLSTGMNPEPYAIPQIPVEAFYHLPYLQVAFLAAVAAYYHSENFLAVAGSQAAIQQLPQLLNPINAAAMPILMPELGYKEHEIHWARNTAVQHYPSLDSENMIAAIDARLALDSRQHLLVINPNNPTAVLIEKSQLLTWAEKLADGAYLIVDEAFIDITPQYSLLSEQPLPDNIIVLRSFGKFFGLAGLRLGFIFAHQHLLNHLRQNTGLWQVNGPAQSIAIKALTDTRWQAQARINIAENAVQTRALFAPLMQSYTTKHCCENGLFSSYLLSRDDALMLADALALQGILTRVVEMDASQALLRIATMAGLNGGDPLQQQHKLRVNSAVESLLAVESLA